MDFITKLRELQDFVDRWGQEVTVMLSPDSEHKPHLSSRLTEGQKVSPGHYLSKDGYVGVDVHSQDPRTGLIVMSVSNSPTPTDRFQSMSPGLFKALFKSVDVDSFSPALLTEVFQHHHELSDEEARLHLEERAKSFNWNSIKEATDAAAQKWRNLNHSLARREWQELQADYLELLFLVFILGGRIGYTPRDDFAKLVQGVMELTDASHDECKATLAHYKERGVKCGYHEYRLFDPQFELAPPHSRFVVYSMEDQTTPEGWHYAKYAFLPSVNSRHEYPPPMLP